MTYQEEGLTVYVVVYWHDHHFLLFPYRNEFVVIHPAGRIQSSRRDHDQDAVTPHQMSPSPKKASNAVTKMTKYSYRQY